MRDLGAALRVFSANVINEEKLTPPVTIQFMEDINSAPFIEMVARGKNQEGVWQFEPRVLPGVVTTGQWEVLFADARGEKVRREYSLEPGIVGG